MSQHEALTVPPSISNPHNNRYQKSPSSIFDSLRFSHDLDRDSLRQYSEEGKDIEFQFQDYPHEDQIEFNVEEHNMEHSQHHGIRKLSLFQKYRINKEPDIEDQTNDIIQSFDKIFNIKQQERDLSSSQKLFKKKSPHQQPITVGSSIETQGNPKIGKIQMETHETQQIDKQSQASFQQLLKDKDINFTSQKFDDNLNTVQTNVKQNNVITNPQIDKVDLPTTHNTHKNSRQSFDLFNLSYLGLAHNFPVLNINSGTISGERPTNDKNKNIVVASEDQVDDKSRESSSDSNQFIQRSIPESLETKISSQKQDSQATTCSQSIKILPYNFSPQTQSIQSLSSLPHPPTNITSFSTLQKIPLQTDTPSSKTIPNLSKTFSSPTSNPPKKNNIINFYSCENINQNQNYQNNENLKSLKNFHDQKSNKIITNNVYGPKSQTPSNEIIKNAPNQIPVKKDNKMVKVVPIHQINPKLTQPIFDGQNRIPPFLRRIRKINSIYPNFNHPNVNLQSESMYCNHLANIFEDTLNFIANISTKIFQKLKQQKCYNNLPIKFLNLQYFLNSRWQLQWNQINTLMKPRINFVKNIVNEQKIINALSNYRQVINYYKHRKIDIRNEEGIATYFRIRNKFWNLERHLRSISQDIYQIYPKTDYPQHCYDYLCILRSPCPMHKEQLKIQFLQKVFNTVLVLQQRNQPLSCSQVGQVVRAKLENELKYLHLF